MAEKNPPILTWDEIITFGVLGLAVLLWLACLLALLFWTGCTVAGDSCDLGCREGEVCAAGRCLPERGEGRR